MCWPWPIRGIFPWRPGLPRGTARPVQQIAKLEKELGWPSSPAIPGGATLTEAGKDFVLRAREILQRAQALQAEMSFYAGLRKGSLNLGIITSLQCINFGGMLSAFCGSYPTSR
ncbi:LysR substrate binding domain protein [Lawsonibacter asaccharolyticus]|nr:LysR substrate binding domain protein [Lawsonibacter asaccharolyticus]